MPATTLTIVLPGVQRGGAPRAGAGRAVRVPASAWRGGARRRARVRGAARGRACPRGRRRLHRRHGDLVRARPETSGELVLLTVPPWRQGRGGPRRDAAARRATSIVFADADMATPPDELVPAGRRARRRPTPPYGSRIQPDGSDMRKTQPPLSAPPGQGVPPARVGVGRRARPGHPVRLQGLHAACARTTCSRASRSRASCSTSRSSTSPGGAAIGWRVVPIRWADRRGSRMRPGARLAARVAWDLFRIPLLHRGLGRAVRDERVAEG